MLSGGTLLTLPLTDGFYHHINHRSLSHVITSPLPTPSTPTPTPPQDKIPEMEEMGLKITTAKNTVGYARVRAAFVRYKELKGDMMVSGADSGREIKWGWQW